MKKFVFLITITFLIFSCNRSGESSYEDVTIPVNVEKLKLKYMEEYLETSGTVYSTHEAVLGSEISGKYSLLKNPRKGRLYKLGDQVDSGEVIIQLRDKEFENGIMQESKKLNLDLTKRLYEQQKSLYEKGGVTLMELTNAERDYINARYDYENAQLNISKMKVIAPFKGVIVDLPYYTPDVRINSGSPVLKVMGYHTLYFEINLPEKELNVIKEGQQVRVFNYSYPKDTFMAAISQLSPVINADTRSFKGYVTVKNPLLQLRPGMFVKAEIVTRSVDSTIVIPRDIVILANNRLIVYVVESGKGPGKSTGTVDERSITKGLENPDEIEVTDGLNAGEELVIKGYETLRDNSKVKIEH